MPNFIFYLETLIASIMGPEHKRHEKISAQLVVENTSLGGHPYGFYYMGQRFSNHAARHVIAESLQPIRQELIPQAHALYTQMKQARSDEQKLRQALSVVLPKCRSKQDVRDVLPEVFIREVSDFRNLNRLRPEGFLLEEFPMLKSQYEKAVDIAKYYTFNKLIY